MQDRSKEKEKESYYSQWGTDSWCPTLYPPGPPLIPSVTVMNS